MDRSLQNGRSAAGNPAEPSRGKVAGALDTARGSAASAGRRAADGLSEAPLIALAGGLAVGALVAALLPRSERERQLLGSAGERVVAGARTAADHAREAGRTKLAEIGKSTVSDTLHAIVGTPAPAGDGAATGRSG